MERLLCSTRMNFQARHPGRIAGITHSRGTERFLVYAKASRRNKRGHRLKFSHQTQVTFNRMIANFVP
eukprot:759161-Pyramimonas_sp.AAC.1